MTVREAMETYSGECRRSPTNIGGIHGDLVGSTENTEGFTRVQPERYVSNGTESILSGYSRHEERIRINWRRGRG